MLLTSGLLLGLLSSVEASPLFEINSWIGFQNYDATGCIMISPFPDGKTGLAVEMVDSDDITIGVRWIEADYSAIMGQDIPGKLLIDGDPPIEVVGHFVQKDYLRFSSERKGLLKHVFTAGRSMRLDYGDGGWVAAPLRGTTKAVERLTACADKQRTAAQFDPKPSSSQSVDSTPKSDQPSASPFPSFIGDKGSLVNQNSFLSISLGDLITKEKLQAIFPMTDIEFQMYPEDGECTDGCYNIASTDKESFKAFLKVNKNGNLLSYSFSGSSVSDSNGNKSGQPFSEIKVFSEIKCESGYSMMCSTTPDAVQYIDPDISCDLKDALTETADGISFVKDRSCFKITSFFFDKT
ncbi:MULTISPECIES: hypothetical protein [Mesorhizobium]|uniref:Uncharacterized protein n=1 Tax=Mesorhizobium ciceri TaxID=39645 RepID=A0AB38T9W0_9HYPH|nr:MULTISPECIES: hypothetical protein [Mesorhizobium]MDF3214825.1 hypothetical protein [Mesorhizobium ciceri]RUY73030.1 hypothetical protein EN980_01550 [Mesorhizobium sp. M7A.F.Ca.CA.001.13.1.1]RUY74472.1 hypothetical protein EN965_00955 [Mesorhizobium sp. M7A.F.Ca.CA.001.05.1.1]RUZ06283.1 hypothetical protein EN955_16175 [Mesorhizobium sp. M7A.F.Ca.CA.001.04.2.1]RUZ26497.1 hypothetical protein EN961_00975 [Mesorhizobium sp. M7A.F.Ca.CA.001.09.1.1]